jgi:hypothetical protein
MNRRSVLKSIPLAAAAGLTVHSAKAADVTEDNRPLGLRYLERVRGMLDRIKNLESDNLLEAAYHVARSIKRRKAILCS